MQTSITVCTGIRSNRKIHILILKKSFVHFKRENYNI